MGRSTITRERERMLDAVRVGFPVDRRRLEVAHRVRFARLKDAEIEAGLRGYDGWRAPHIIGSRVLLIYPAVEGVVISYEESRRYTGAPSAAESIVRWDDGSEGLCSNSALAVIP